MILDPRRLVLLGIFVVACHTPNTPLAHPPSPGAIKAFPLPGATGPVTLDYLACDRAHGKVWLPVGDTGSVDVFDIGTSTFARVDGFKTAEREARGKKRMMGPSSVTLGDGYAYVGDRASSEVCAIDEKTLQLGKCLALPVAPDGVVYVASAKEVWVTTPHDDSVTVLDASKPDTLAPKLVIKTEGAPEGYAVDLAHGLFYTNLEDKNRTVAIDLATHAIKSSWAAGCGEDGPRGLAVDGARNFVYVACTDGIQVLDSRSGAAVGKIAVGAGVDNIDFLEDAKLLFVAAAKAARLTTLRIDDQGQPSVVATNDTAVGARNAVADARGNAYLVNPQTARLLVVTHPGS